MHTSIFLIKIIYKYPKDNKMGGGGYVKVQYNWLI